MLGGTTKGKDSRINGAWNADLVEAFVGRAGDPETDLVSWLRGGCPAGVAKNITSCGIFPAVVAEQASMVEAGDRASADEPSGNYTSVESEAELSGAEADRLIAKGYAVKYET